MNFLVCFKKMICFALPRSQIPPCEDKHTQSTKSDIVTAIVTTEDKPDEDKPFTKSVINAATAEYVQRVNNTQQNEADQTDNQFESNDVKSLNKALSANFLVYKILLD